MAGLIVRGFQIQWGHRFHGGVVTSTRLHARLLQKSRAGGNDMQIKKKQEPQQRQQPPKSQPQSSQRPQQLREVNKESSSSLQQPIVVLEKGKARLFQDGNPLIYGGAVKTVLGNPQAGDDVLVQDHMGNTIGRGFFNPFSQYRVRMMARPWEPMFNSSLTDILSNRINSALALRLTMNLISPDKNTVYRLLNGEGDRCSGLIVDVMGDTVVAQSSALWTETHRKSIEESLLKIMPTLMSKVDIPSSQGRLIWRRVESRLKQDGYTGSVEDHVLSMQSDTETHTITKTEKPSDTPRYVLENSLKFMCNPDDGQKTGFYCDQRDNRNMLRQLAAGKTVLDAFCYSGGFGISAAVGGATRVVCVDSSKPALDTGMENARLNNVENVVEFVKSDCEAFFRASIERGDVYDIVIADPPKLAPTRSSLAKAKAKYVRINALAMSCVKPGGGLLLTCTCSAAATQSGEFPSFIAEASRVALRDVTILSSSSAGADHPVHSSYVEGDYLTALLVYVN